MSIHCEETKGDILLLSSKHILTGDVLANSSDMTFADLMGKLDIIQGMIIYLLVINTVIGSTLDIAFEARSLISQSDNNASIKYNNNKWNNPDIFSDIAPFITDHVDENPFKSVSRTARLGALAFKSRQSSDWYERWMRYNFHLVLNQTDLSVNDLSAFKDVSKFTFNSIQQGIIKSLKTNSFIHRKMPHKWKGVELSTGKSYLTILIRTISRNEIGLLSIIFDHNENGNQFISNVTIKDCMRMKIDKSVLINPLCRISINFIQSDDYQFCGSYSDIFKLLSDENYIWSVEQNDTHCRQKVITSWEKLEELARSVRKNTMLWNCACLVVSVFYLCGFLYLLHIGERNGSVGYLWSFVVAFALWQYI